MISNQLVSSAEHAIGQMNRLLVYNIHYVSHFLVRKANRELNKAGLSLQFEQLPILFVVDSYANGLLSQQEIANALQKDKSGIQRSIRSLERDGYLRVMADAVDRRKNLIQLTPAGKSMIEKITRVTEEINQELTIQLHPDEVVTLLTLLRKVSILLDK